MNKFLLFIFVFLVTLLCSEVYGGPGTFLQGDHIKQFRDKLEFKNGNVQIISNDTDDPTVIPKDADRGSLYIRATDGKHYRKTDDGNSTGWEEVLDFTSFLSDLINVSATPALVNDVLVFDGSEWRNQATASLTSIEINGSTPITSISTGVADNDKLPTEGYVNDLTNALLGTRLMDGGEISISATDGAKFDISAGSGFIVNNYTDPYNPIITKVTWDATTEQTVTDLATNALTVLAIDSSGNIIQQGTLLTSEQSRDYIFSGSVSHPSHVAINGLNNAAEGISFDIVAFIIDMFRAYGPENVSGNVFSASGANMKINKTAGVVFFPNSNLKANKKNPHNTTVSLCNECNFFYTWKDGSGGFNTATASEINADAYDNNNGGALEPSDSVLPQQWTVQRGWITTDLIILHYGQEVYGSRLAAENSIGVEEFTVNPDLETTLHRIYLIVRGGGTDLENDAVFVTPSSSTAGGQAAVSLNNWVTVEVDHTTNPNNVTGCNNVYLADASGGAVTVTLPDSSTSNNECQNRFLLDKDTNSLTVTTVGGTQLIGDDTSQIISQVKKGFTVLSVSSGPYYVITQDSRFLAGTTDGAIQRWNNTDEAWEEVSSITATESLLKIDADLEVTGTASISELGVTTAATAAILTVTGTLTLEAVTEVATQSTFLSIVSGEVVKFVQSFLIDSMTTIGDMLYRNGSNITVRLPRGADDQILKMNGTIPNWEAETGGGGGLTWNVVTVDTTMSANNGYIANISDTATPLKFYLPTTMATGSIFSITGLGNDGWELYTNSGTATQSLIHKGYTTATSSYTSIKLAESIQDWGSVDLITSENDLVVISRNYNEVGFDTEISYFSGIIAHWKLDESSGDFTDSKNNYDLSRIGTPTSVDGKFENAASGFVSNTAHMKHFYADLILSEGVSTEATFETWVKFVNVVAGGVQILALNTNSVYDRRPNALNFFQEGTNLRIAHGSSPYSQVDTSGYVDGEWHHVVGVVDSTSVSGSTKWIYIDGVSVGTVENSVNGYTDGDGYIIIGGSSVADQNWQGSIDDVTFWEDTAMTHAQVLERYNSGDGRRYY